MQRFDWLARFFRPAPRKRAPRPARGPKPERVWCWEGRRVKARTKSEARARLKALCGLPRLPPGALVLEEVGLTIEGWL